MAASGGCDDDRAIYDSGLIGPSKAGGTGVDHAKTTGGIGCFNAVIESIEKNRNFGFSNINLLWLRLVFFGMGGERKGRICHKCIE
jgi:hypothetical protein